MSHEGMGKHACCRAHPSDSKHRRDVWIKSSLRVSDLKAGLHQFVTARWRRRQSFQRCTTSCFSAKSFKRRSWTHRRRSLRAVYATWTGRHGRTSATMAWYGARIWENETFSHKHTPNFTHDARRHTTCVSQTSLIKTQNTSHKTSIYPTMDNEPVTNRLAHT